MLVMLFGAAGFHAAYPDKTYLDALYCSLQLFTLNSGAIDGTTPWPLEIARWLAPLTLAGGALGAMRLFFGERWNLWRARRMSGHHVICGLGEKGWALAEGLLKLKEKKVVALDPNPDSEYAASFCKAGGLLLKIKASGRIELIAVNVAKAHSLIAVTNKDADNLALALAAAELAEEADRKGPPLDICTHIGSVAYRDLLDRNAFLEASSQPGSSIRTFNYHANLARILLDENPLDTAGHPDGATNPARKIHLVLSDLCDSATALLIHVARTGHYSAGRKVHVHLITQGASKLLKSLKLRYPGLVLCVASLEASDAEDTEDANEFSHKAATLIQNSAQDCFTVFPAFSSDPGRLDDILRLHECVPQGTGFRMPIPMSLKSLLASVVSRQPSLAARLAEFRSPQNCCGSSVVFNEDLDRRAISIRKGWLAENAKQIGKAEERGDLEKVTKLKSKPTYNKQWGELTEEQKDSNRSQADHISLKIRTAGHTPDITAKAWHEWCATSPNVVESLSRMEHERWMAHAYLAGWTYAAQRDDSKKQHPDLVPYDLLDDGSKEFDRKTVEGLADYLAAGQNGSSLAPQ